MNGSGHNDSKDARKFEKATVTRILHITDFHFLAEPGQTLLGVDTEQTFAAVLEHALHAPWKPNLVLLTGDLVQDPRYSSYERLKQRLSVLGIPCYCLPGNHDDPQLMSELLPSENVHVQHRIMLDPWQIVCLDSTISGKASGRLSDEQLGLLEQSLINHPDCYTLIALHHHVIPSGSRWMDTMVLENAGEFLAITQKYSHARAVVFGHVHQEIDKVFGWLRLLATPSTCFQFKPLSPNFALEATPPGYRWIELYADGTIGTGVERLTEMPPGLELRSKGY